MYFKKELKAALKELKSKNDFTYQAGVNDALDLLDEMKEFIVLENSTQQNAQVTITGISEEKKESMTAGILPPDFSEMKQLAQKLIDTPMPEIADLEIPDISSHISDEELVMNTNDKEKVPSDTQRPEFKGWAESEADGNDSEYPTKINEELKEESSTTLQDIYEDTPKTTQSLGTEVQDTPNSSENTEKEESKIIEVTPEEQEKLRKAQLLAEARAQALAEAEELEEDDDE
ncbi:MAG: hypothetical protein KH106_03545 [Lactococcus lactis]|nr:hypothetical protein [Lactococcus lactis]